MFVLECNNRRVQSQVYQYHVRNGFSVSIEKFARNTEFVLMLNGFTNQIHYCFVSVATASTFCNHR